MKTLFDFSFHGDFGSTPPPSAQKLEYPPTLARKMRLYLVLSFKTPKNNNKTNIFEFYCNFKLYICRNSPQKSSPQSQNIGRAGLPHNANICLSCSHLFSPLQHPPTLAEKNLGDDTKNSREQGFHSGGPDMYV